MSSGGRLRGLTVPLAAALAAVLAGPSPAPAERAYEYREVFSPDGTITRVRVPVAPPPAAALDVPVGPVSALGPAGPVGTKIDIAIVGDGYTKRDAARFRTHASKHVAELFSVEPFRRYRDLFNVWLVPVESPESGVDNDPTPGISRDTALDMAFWCGGTERLLCVNTAKAKAAAEDAPEADIVLAIANSTKYGGAGGAVATASGGNERSGQVVIHELGHTIGDLADEYDTAHTNAPAVPEPDEANVSIYREELMAAQETKWHRRLGEPTPDGGRIGTFLGGRYNPVVYYRPSENSIMRTLGKAFNTVGREAMVIAFYDLARPIESATSGRVSRTGRITVVPAKTVGTPLRVTWTVDGKPLTTRATRLDLRALRLRPGSHTVTVTVTDTTPWVIDEVAREELMSESRTWTVR